MLVLSRKNSEKILIGKDGEIEIIVVEIRGGEKVRLGITAPKGVPVHREEVFDAIKRSEAESKKLSEIQDGPVNPDDYKVDGAPY